MGVGFYRMNIDDGDWQSCVRNKKMIKVYSFFSGIGFLDFGFEKAGFNIVFVNEINKNFLEAYKFARQNIAVPPVHGYSDKSADVFLNDKEWEKISDSFSYNDIIGFIGGPPCPDFSVAGVNEGCQGKNGQLTQTYVDLIKKREPDFFVFENVKGLYTTKKHREFFEKIKNELESWNKDDKIMFKFTIPTVPNYYLDLYDYECVVRIVALSGGYSIDDAVKYLSENNRSFSRALLQDLNAHQSQEEFDSKLNDAIVKIYDASIS